MKEKTKNIVESLIGKVCTKLLEDNYIIVLSADDLNDLFVLNSATTLINLSLSAAKSGRTDISTGELLEYAKHLSSKINPSDTKLKYDA